jgi:hypothetical protein
MLNVIMLNVKMLNVIMLNVSIVNVSMLNVVILNVIMLNVVMLKVMAPADWCLFFSTAVSLGGWRCRFFSKTIIIFKLVSKTLLSSAAYPIKIFQSFKSF